jgi:hypothetical protein
MGCACQMLEYRVARQHFNNASPPEPYTEDCISAMPCFQLTRGAYPSSRRALLILTVNGFPIRRSICRVTGGSPFRLACAYGVLKVGSISYPINLLAAVAYRESLALVPAQLNSFHADAFAIAFVLHGIVSIFVGMLYGAMLPMFPRRPIVLGGFIAPALWSGLLYTTLGLLNPLLASHIDWFWFMASQLAFGVVAGLVVVRQPSFPTRENVSFALRAGIEAPGTMPPRENGETPR